MLRPVEIAKEDNEQHNGHFCYELAAFLSINCSSLFIVILFQLLKLIIKYHWSMESLNFKGIITLILFSTATDYYFLLACCYLYGSNCDFLLDTPQRSIL